jgi:hypothetical protein
VFMLISFMIQSLFKTRQRDWIIFFSGFPAGLALMLCIETWPF